MENRFFTMPSSMAVQMPERQNYCVITEQDYHILLEGSGTSDGAARDLCIGIFATALTAAGGLFAATSFHEQNRILWLPIGISCFFSIATLVTLVLAVFFHIRTKESAGRKSFSLVKKRIEGYMNQSQGATAYPASLPASGGGHPSQTIAGRVEADKAAEASGTHG